MANVGEDNNRIERIIRKQGLRTMINSSNVLV